MGDRSGICACGVDLGDIWFGCWMISFTGAEEKKWSTKRHFGEEAEGL